MTKVFIINVQVLFTNQLFLLFDSEVFLLGKVLQAMDRNKATFLDVLIECDQKTVVSNAAVSHAQTLTATNNFNAEQVQSYLNELWRGGLSWTGNSLKLVLLFFAMVVCPPIWIFFSLPLNIRMNKVPYVKFICRTVSHFFLLLLLVVTGKFAKTF